MTFRGLLFAMLFDNGFDDHEATFKILNGNNLVSSCTNVLSFRPIMSRVYAVYNAQFLPCLHNNLTIDLHSVGPILLFETDWNIAILIFDE